MASVKKQIFNFVSSTLGDLLTEAGTPQDITWKFGASALAKTDYHPPAIVWVPTQDTPLTEMNVSQGVLDNNGDRADVLCILQNNFDVHIWGSDDLDDVSATEELRDNFIVACYRSLSGSYGFDLGATVTTWTSQDPNEETSKLGFIGQRAVLPLGVKT